ncbi:MAG: mandelate racemase/muconate lactonizing enzyme family protein [Victivallaceae bacterium]|jgi:galactonate dehydratase
MKITNVTTILLTGPCTMDPFISEARKRRSAAFIKIETDSGLEGLGETYAGYFFPEGVPPIVDFFKPVLLGQDPEKSDLLWERMYHCGNFWCRVGMGAIVLAGIEAALWDLRGKINQQPVYKLLAGKWNKRFPMAEDFDGHEKMLAYATGGPSNYPLETLAKKVEFYQSCGFRGVKIGSGSFTPEDGFAILTEPQAAADFEAEKSTYLRQRFGQDLLLMYDAHMGNHPTATWNFDTALAVAKALEEFDLVFFEEPLHYTRPDWYGELTRQTTTPIAGGECLTAVCEWQTFIDRDAFKIGQPDASFTAGLSQFMQIAARLAERGAQVAPHAWGAGGSQMQNIHCGFACPNTRIIEAAPAYGPLHSEVIGDSFKLKDGFLMAPEKPGLGIELTPATIAKFPFVPGSGEFNSVPGKILVD